MISAASQAQLNPLHNFQHASHLTFFSQTEKDENRDSTRKWPGASSVGPWDHQETQQGFLRLDTPLAETVAGHDFFSEQSHVENCESSVTEQNVQFKVQCSRCQHLQSYLGCASVLPGPSVSDKRDVQAIHVLQTDKKTVFGSGQLKTQKDDQASVSVSARVLLQFLL